MSNEISRIAFNIQLCLYQISKLVYYFSTGMKKYVCCTIGLVITVAIVVQVVLITRKLNKSNKESITEDLQLKPGTLTYLAYRASL